MGQQQLLLLAISIVIAAIAILAGIEAVQQGLLQSAADRLVERNLAVASSAVAWKTRKDPFDGGDESYLGLETNGMARLSLNDSTDAGVVGITSATESTLEITSVSSNYPQIGVRTQIEEYTIVSTIVRYDGTITLEN